MSCARVSWAGMLFSARVDGIGPFCRLWNFFWAQVANIKGGSPRTTLAVKTIVCVFSRATRLSASS